MANNDKDDFEDIETSGFGVPEAPAPRAKQPENLPDWAKITSSIVEETEDAGEIFDKPAVQPYVPPKKGFGVPLEELSDDDLFLDESPIEKNKPAAPVADEPIVNTPEPVYYEEVEEEYVAPPASERKTAEPVSRTIPEYDESEDFEEETIEEEPVVVNNKSGKKIPKAKAKNPRPVKSARSVKKAISSGVMGKESDILAPRGRMAGNRWKLIGLRTAVWGTLGIIMLSGVLAIFGPKGPSIATITQQVLLNINRNNFPLEAGQQLAARFVKEYMTITTDDASVRQDILKTYIIGSGSEESQISFFSSSRPQRVIGEPILAMPAELVSDSHVVYTFAVQVFQPAVAETEKTPGLAATKPSWVYIAVPMAADSEGAIGVSGMPAFVPQPKIAEKAEAIKFTQDSDAERSSRSQIEKFLLHWAASDEVSLKPYLVDEVSSPSARAGLGGTLEYVGLEDLAVEAFPVDYVQDPDVPPTCSAPDYALPCRDAYVKVKWNYQGLEISNRYRMVLLFDGENWRVIDIRGTNFEKVGG